MIKLFNKIIWQAFYTECQAPIPVFWIPKVCGGACEFAFLRSSQKVWMIQVQGHTLRAHCDKYMSSYTWDLGTKACGHKNAVVAGARATGIAGRFRSACSYNLLLAGMRIESQSNSVCCMSYSFLYLFASRCSYPSDATLCCWQNKIQVINLLICTSYPIPREISI